MTQLAAVTPAWALGGTCCLCLIIEPKTKKKSHKDIQLFTKMRHHRFLRQWSSLGLAHVRSWMRSRESRLPKCSVFGKLLARTSSISCPWKSVVGRWWWFVSCSVQVRPIFRGDCCYFQGVYLSLLEDHPRTCKWLITMVTVSPLTGVVPLPNGLNG